MAAAQIINVRLNEDGVDYIDTLARDLNITRSVVIRSMFRVASRHRKEVIEDVTQLRAHVLA